MSIQPSMTFKIWFRGLSFRCVPLCTLLGFTLAQLVKASVGQADVQGFISGITG